MSLLSKSIAALALAFFVLGLMAQSPSAPDSEAVLVETTYRAGVDNTGEVIRHEKWKALTSQGRTNISKVQIPYVAAFQDVEFKVIRTLKKDGTVIDGDPATAFDAAASSDTSSSFDDSKLRTIFPPSPETGDSIEFEAILHVHRWPKKDAFWFEHFLRADVPVVFEKVVLDLPADRKVAISENGSVPGKTEVAGGRRIEQWFNVNPEPRRAGLEREAPLFAVSSLLSWDDFGAWIRTLNAGPAEPAPEIAALASKLTAGKATEEERIAALYAFVATKVRYVALSFGLGRIQPHTASTVLHNAYGDCKDQTALLSALLKAAGYKTSAVLTMPGAGVLVRDVPLPDQFNHEFAAVETKAGLLFLDTSMGPVQPGVLARGVRGRSAVLLGESGASLIDIPINSPVPNKTSAALKGKITAGGVFEGSARFEFQGVAEVGVRRFFADATEAEREGLLRAVAGPQFLAAKIRQIQSGDPDDLTKPYWIQCELSDPDFFPPAKKSLRIGLGAKTSMAALFEQMKKPDRPLPVEAMSASESFDLIIDPNLTIENGMPVHRKADFGGVDSEFSYEKGHLLLARSFELNGSAIAPQNWAAFIDFMRTAETDTARSFALERNTPSTSVRLPPVSQSLEEGDSAYRRHDYEAAKRAYLEAIKLDTQNHSEAWNNLGRAYAALHDYGKAESAYQRQIEINPKDLYAYNNLGVTYRAMKREGDAIASFRKEIAITPRDRFAHDNLAISLAAMNKWEEARAEEEIAVEISPEDVTKRVRLGRTQVKTGHIAEAAKNFDRALAQPHDAMVENNIAYYMTEGGMDLKRAWQLVSGALNPAAKVPCRPETLATEDACVVPLTRLAHMLDTAGWVLYRQGKVAESEPYLASAFAISPHAETETHFSTLLARLGRVEESLRCLADASSLTGFTRADATEVRRELVKAIGGEGVLDSRLKQLQADRSAADPTVHVLALVDEHGRVLDARSLDSSVSDAVIREAKSLTLTPISWSEYSMRSIRTIEFRQGAGKWSVVRSYVGQAAGQASTP